MKNVVFGVGYLLAAVAAIFIVPIIILLFLCLGLLMWACGIPLTVKQGGREIGKVRWFTFHRYDHGGLAGPPSITRRR